VEPATGPGRVRPAGWWFDAALLAATAALTGALAAGWLDGLDMAVHEWCMAHRPQWAYWAARGFNLLGNGGPLASLCGVVALVLAVRRRSVRPVLLVAFAFVLTVVAITPLKVWTDRAAPSSDLPDRVQIFNALPPGEYDWSYPSGHLVNTIVWYGVLALLLAPWLSATALRWLRVAPPAIVFCTTVYLDFHWLTDSVAGVFLGVVLDRLIARVSGRLSPWRESPGRLDGPGLSRRAG
jgi:membrane-associated phospholipid phosphatase